MTKIDIHFKNKDIVYFEIKGHSNFSEYGKDIVCASISSIITMTINGMVGIANLKNVKYTIKDGYANCDLSSLNDKELQSVYLLTQSMYEMLESISKEYKKNVKLKIKEV